MRSVERPPRDKNGHETHEPEGLLFHSHSEALEPSPRARRQVWQEGLSPCRRKDSSHYRAQGSRQTLRPGPGTGGEGVSAAGWAGGKEGKGRGEEGGKGLAPTPRRWPRTPSRSARGPGPGAGSAALFLRLVPGPRPCPLPRAYNPGCAPPPALLRRLPPPPASR